jgi:hypothetical protein
MHGSWGEYGNTFLISSAPEYLVCFRIQAS